MSLPNVTAAAKPEIQLQKNYSIVHVTVYNASKLSTRLKMKFRNADCSLKVVGWVVINGDQVKYFSSAFEAGRFFSDPDASGGF